MRRDREGRRHRIRRGVNIVARLEALAEPGGITISDAVQGAVRGKVAASFVDQGEQQVKNIPYPGGGVPAIDFDGPHDRARLAPGR